MTAHTRIRVPLKDMGLPELRTELAYELDRMDQQAQETLFAAAQVAVWAHRDQTRKWRKGQPRTPYAEHPLRCCLRLIRKNVTDVTTLAASLLHDVVEDCADEIAASDLGGTQGFDTDGVSELSLRLLATRKVSTLFSDDIAHIVSRVSNPVLDADVTRAEKTQAYLDHLEELVDSGDVAAMLVKASDLLDNAGSLKHQKGYVDDAMIIKLVSKYAMALPIIIDGLHRHSDPNTDSVSAEMILCLQTTLTTIRTIAEEMDLAI